MALLVMELTLLDILLLCCPIWSDEGDVKAVGRVPAATTRPVMINLPPLQRLINLPAVDLCTQAPPHCRNNFNIISSRDKGLWGLYIFLLPAAGLEKANRSVLEQQLHHPVIVGILHTVGVPRRMDGETQCSAALLVRVVHQLQAAKIRPAIRPA
jgi:hypothetical protein